MAAAPVARAVQPACVGDCNGDLRAAANDLALRQLLAIPTATRMALMGPHRIIIVVASV